ncbi:MAG: ATP-dependent zinc metalloprotease FtsH [Kiritimatiellia bacterium]
MADQPLKETPQKSSKGAPDLSGKEPEQKSGWKRPLIVWVLLAVLIFSIAQVFFGDAKGTLGVGKKEAPLTQLDFWQRVEAGVQREGTKIVSNTILPEVTLVRESGGESFLEGEWGKEQGQEAKPKKFRLNVLGVTDLEKRLESVGIRTLQENRSNWLGPILASLLPLLLLFVLFYFLFMRQMRGGQGGNPFEFGKSRAKLLNKEDAKVHFADVAGVEEAKEEVEEIVEFLKEPKRFEDLGGKVPKGILLMGPPGTGKTLLAKAIAGEAAVPFFSISGSDFVEMFVGVGASRVRDMFEQAKKNAPCILFIDEIDAIGRTRFTGIGGGHDEREQTLNAMLVEMDGFEGNSGVIVMAATNRVDVLDPALTRPGRFDRQIVVDLPTREGRLAILQVHAKKIKLAEDVDLDRIARGTPGFSGADLANLLNEGALLAARAHKTAVGHLDLEEARDKVLWGRERRSHTMADRERRMTAWHEGGHALAQVLLEHTEPLHKVTIIPRGRALGATMTLPERDVLNRTEKEMKDMLVVMCAGRIAEKLYTGDLSTGASQDIKMATNLARRMVCAYGMSDSFGFQFFGDNEDMVYLGRDMGRKQDHSESTAQMIDAEVSKMMHEAYARSEKLINDHRDRLEMLVDYLLEVETADGRDVELLIATGERPVKKVPVAVAPVGTPLPSDVHVIAIDGPSGAGKSSVSRAVGQRLGFLHVDSGALYRIMTWQCLEHGVDTSDPVAVAACVADLQIDYAAEEGRIVYAVNGLRPDKELREPRINAHASPVATVPAVRHRITDDLRSLTRFGNLIVEGRDITTAVFPESPARFYLEADPTVRAQRRQAEEVEKGVAQQTVETVKASLLARDKVDSTRACDPLRVAEGAVRIDSTLLSLEEVIQTVLDALPEAWKSTPVVSDKDL